MEVESLQSRTPVSVRKRRKSGAPEHLRSTEALRVVKTKAAHVERPWLAESETPNSCVVSMSLNFLNRHSSAGNFFQLLLIDIEVRVDVLHVVVIFESFHQADHG